VGHSGMSDDDKIKLINLFNDKGFIVFISSEGALPDNLKKYSLQLPPEYIHSALFEADMFIGESGTMATEAAILGTPSVLINSLDAGVFKELVACGLLYHIKTMDAIVEIVKDFDLGEDLKEKHIINRDRLLSEKIDLTKFLIWFIENYPESASTMKKNPDYQNKFK
jgi:predicted glycosyltransferase